MHLLFAALTLDPGNWVAWIIAGGLAGFVAGRFMGGGWGFFGDFILGLIGAALGWFVLGLFINGAVAWWGTFLIAIVGALVVLGISRAITGTSRTTA